MKISWFLPVGFSLLFGSAARATPPVWSGYGGNAQHTSVSTVAAQRLDAILWQAPVDLLPQYTSGGSLLAHYGSPMVTAANTVLVPVKTGATDGFRVDARSGADGSLLWQYNSDYSLPSHNWTPSYSPTVTPAGRLFLPGAGGTLLYRDGLDATGSVTPTRIAFYGDANYAANTAAFNAGVQICTPLTSDSQGNVYFGFRADGTAGGVTSGLARVGANGATSFVTATGATGGVASRVAMNCAPAISNDGSTVYVAMSDNSSHGVLVALNAATLGTTAQVALKDPKTGGDALLSDQSTAAPTVAPNSARSDKICPVAVARFDAGKYVSATQPTATSGRRSPRREDSTAAASMAIAPAALITASAVRCAGKMVGP